MELERISSLKQSAYASSSLAWMGSPLGQASLFSWRVASSSFTCVKNSLYFSGLAAKKKSLVVMINNSSAIADDSFKVLVSYENR